MFLWMWLACNSTTEAPDSPDWRPNVIACPGDPDCAQTGDAPLTAGAAVADIVPTCFESWTDVDGDAAYNASTDTFADCGCDRVCPGDAAWSNADSGEGDETFQAAWIAGFGNGRAATGVRGASDGLAGAGDGLWARVLVLEQGDATLALVTLDVVGFFYDDVLKLRAAIAAQTPAIDHVLVHATHVHQAPDSMGLWGPTVGRSGVDPAWMAHIEAAASDAVARAYAARVPVHTRTGEVHARDYASNGVANLISDTRDPVIIDDLLGAMQFLDDDDQTVATLVSFGNHPETRGSDNLLLTSDYVHALRKTVESGVDWGEGLRPGVGGTALFLNAAVGGMMTSLHAEVHDPMGRVWSDASWEKADASGQLLGEMALDALAQGTDDAAPALQFGAQSRYLPVENHGLQAMTLMGIIQRATYHWDPEQPITADNRPDIQTEVNVLAIGDTRLMGIPGELLPEVWIGGYDGAYTPPGTPILSPDNPNPPDLALAPTDGGWRVHAGTTRTWILGLANDEIGYLIPPFAFELDPTAPYLFEAEGDHYEETNSLGPETVPLLEAEVVSLLDWKP